MCQCYTSIPLPSPQLAIDSLPVLYALLPTTRPQHVYTNRVKRFHDLKGEDRTLPAVEPLYSRPDAEPG